MSAEATQTSIVQRLNDLQSHYDDRYGEPLRLLAVQLAHDAKAEITRLQSELNTALERVKVLEGKLVSRGSHVIEDAERAIEIHEGVLKLKAENRTLRDTLWQFNNPPDPASLREAADEIDCGPDCERGHVEFDTGAHVCSRRDRDGCPGDLAAHLREFANAVEVRAVIQSSGGK